MQDQLSNIAEFFDALTSNEISQLRAAHDELMSLPPEDLADLSDALDAVAVNPDLYPALKRAAAEAGDDSLPAEYNPQAISILNAVTKSAVGSMTRKPMRSGGIAGIHPTDTITAHITPGEALLLESRGGAGTVNPMTGNREYFLKNIGKIFKKVGKTLKKAAPLILSIGATALLGPAGLGLSPMVAGAVGSGLSTLVTGGSPADALKSAAIGGTLGFAASKLGLAGGETATAAAGKGVPATAGKGVTAAAGAPPTAKALRAMGPSGAKATVGAAAPTGGGITAGLTDKASSFWQNSLSPNRGMPTAQEITGSPAYQALRDQGLSPDKAFELVGQQMTPSAFSRFGPLAALGVGTLALTGGFDEEEPEGPTAQDVYQQQQQQVDQMLTQDPQAFSIFPASLQGGFSMAPYQAPAYQTNPNYRIGFKTGGLGGKSDIEDTPGMEAMGRGFNAQRDSRADRSEGPDRSGFGGFVSNLANKVGESYSSAKKQQVAKEKRMAALAESRAEMAARDRFLGPGRRFHRGWNKFFGYESKTPQFYSSATSEGPRQTQPPPPTYRPPVIPPGWTPQGYIAANPDLQQYLQRFPEATQGMPQEQWLRQHWMTQGAQQNRPFMPAQQLRNAQGLFSSLRGTTGGALNPESNMYSDPYQGGLASLSIQNIPRVNRQMGGPGFQPDLYLQSNWDVLHAQELAASGQMSAKDRKYWEKQYGPGVFSTPQSFARAHYNYAQRHTPHQAQRYWDALARQQAMAPRPAAPRSAAPSSSSSSSYPSVTAGYPGGIGELPGARPLYPGADSMLPPPPQYVHEIPNVAGIPYTSVGTGFTNALDTSQQYFNALNAGADPLIIAAAERAPNEGIMMAGGGSPKMQLPYNNNDFKQTSVGPRINGQVQGPGTDTSDNIAAALSPNEFVFTARAVRGAGDGDMGRGIQAMYDLMHSFEQRA